MIAWNAGVASAAELCEARASSLPPVSAAEALKCADAIRELARSAASSPPRRVLAIDPGIDLVAGAFYDLDETRIRTGRFEDALRCFREVMQHRTSADEEVIARLGEIGRWTAGEVHRLEVDLVVIEAPARVGAYQERQDRQRTKANIIGRGEALLNRAMGAITAGAELAGARCVELSASLYPHHFRDKKARHKAMNDVLVRLKRPPLKGNVDTRDAAFIGAFYLSLRRPR
jgi:hypothetical protein